MAESSIVPYSARKFRNWFLIISGCLCFVLWSCQDNAATPTPVVTPVAINLVAVSSTAISVTTTLTPTTTLTTTTPITVCSPPSGWIMYVIQRDDTLSFLSLSTNTTVEKLQQANCLKSDLIVIGQPLWLPMLPPPTPTEAPTPTSAPTPTTCGPPASWTTYQVRNGDTLSGLAFASGLSIDDLKLANCLSGDQIVIGQVLSLPIQPLAVEQRALTLSTPPLVMEPAQPTDTPTSLPLCTSSFSCPTNTEGMPPLVMEPGSPNNPGFAPCSDRPDLNSHDPFISMGDTIEAAISAEQGSHFYFIGCDFPSNKIVSHQIDGPDSAPSILIRTYTFEGKTYPMIEWPVSCDAKIGNYTITFSGEQGKTASRSFEIRTPRFQRIFVIFDEQRAGGDFQIYLCNYTSEQEVLIDLYRLIPGQSSGHEPITSMNVPVVNGQAVFSLHSSLDDMSAQYVVRDRLSRLKGIAQLWIVQ